MSTIDTSTWNPDANLNTEIGGIPLNADAGIAQTWQVIRILMAAFKGDTSAIQALMVPFSGATASADGTSGLVPKPEAGDQDKVLKGDGTWGVVDVSAAWEDVEDKPSTFPPSSHSHGNLTNDGKLSTASRVVVTDGSKVIGVSSITTTKLGYLTDVTANIQGQIDGKADSATTLAGYGITDAKIANGTITLGSNSITPLTSDSNYVHTSGDEVIAGNKTFTWDQYLRDNSATYDSSTGGSYSLIFKDKNDVEVGRIQNMYSSSDNCTLLRVYLRDRSRDYQVGLRDSGAIYFGPRGSGSSGTINLGQAGNHWKEVFAYSSAINTSDARFKKNVSNISDKILDAWENIDWKQFKMVDAIEAKGEDRARWHTGLIAQDLDKVFSSLGLEIRDYGFFCYDEWLAEPRIEKDGEVLNEGREAGNQYALRYIEALSIEAAYMRRENSLLKKRISDLEKQLASSSASIDCETKCSIDTNRNGDICSDSSPREFFKCIQLPEGVSNPERTVLCADGVWRDISQVAFLNVETKDAI